MTITKELNSIIEQIEPVKGWITLIQVCSHLLPASQHSYVLFLIVFSYRALHSSGLLL